MLHDARLDLSAYVEMFESLHVPGRFPSSRADSERLPVEVGFCVSFCSSLDIPFGATLGQMLMNQL